MQENFRLVVGVDIGTSKVRVAAGSLNESGEIVISGVAEVENSGMSKGEITKIDAPAAAIDKALGEVERMSGLEVNQATVSLNGTSILSTNVSGMIAVADSNLGVQDEDVARLEEVASTGKVPVNREILSIIAHEYILDGQAGIKDPLGMVGSRLDINANVVSALSPQLHSLQRACEQAHLVPSQIIVSVLAAAEAVLDEGQRENGVAVVDFGHATTSVAIFEEGDLRHVAVIPVGGRHLTNDLATMLSVTPDIAEQIKLAHASAISRKIDKQVSIKVDRKSYDFSLHQVDEAVGARLEELFELIREQIARAGYEGRLPNGLVLVGGGSNLRELAKFAKQQLGMMAAVAKPNQLNQLKGLTEKVSDPAFAAAVGLMMIDITSPAESKSDVEASAKSGLFTKFKQLFKPGAKS